MLPIAVSHLTMPSVTPAAPSGRFTPAKPVTFANPAPALKEDSVRLSPAAQARMLHREGQSVTVIAASLGTNVSSVDGYLNIKAAVAASPQPAAPAEAAVAASPQPAAPAEAAQVAASPEPAAPAEAVPLVNRHTPPAEIA